jgi:hypothetical protein
MNQPPPRPSFALTLGVTGHRPRRDPKPGEDHATQGAQLRQDKVRQGIDYFLELLESAVADLRGAGNQWSDSAPMVIAMVSSLAEGSDRIAAKAALARRMPLDVVLPCPRESYERTFGDDASRAEFSALVDRARACQILPLTAEARLPSKEDLARAYELAGLTLLAQADILLAVWDGETARGRGGTGDIVDQAARQGTPIVVIDPIDGTARLLWGGGGSSAPPAMRARELPVAEVGKSILVDVVRGVILAHGADRARTGAELERRLSPSR